MSEGIGLKKIKIGDALAAFFVLLSAVSVLLLLPKNSRNVVVSYGDKRLTYDIGTDRDIYVENNGVRLHIRIENSRVYVAECDCPDKTCQKTGKISYGCIVCLPGQTVVSVEDGEVDVIAG